MPIPGPFDRMIPRALKGDLTAEGLVTALDALKPAPIAPIAVPVATSAATPASRTSAARPVAPAEATTPAAVLAAIADGAPAIPPSRGVAADPFDAGMGRLRNQPRRQTRKSLLLRFKPMRAVSRNTWIAAAAAIVMLTIILWNTAFSRRPAADTHAAVAESVPRAVSAQPLQNPTASTTPSNLFTSSEQAGWRVIAYTYNYEQQARAKAQKIRQRYAALEPQVFSPTGHAPYFVALGGPSDAASAVALRNRARRAGLPKDTYARNF